MAKTRKSIIQVLSKTPFNFFIKSLYVQIKRICPYSDTYINAYIDKLLIQSGIVALFTAIVFIFFNKAIDVINLYAFIYSILLAYIIFNEISNSKISSLEKRVSEQFVFFLDNMRSNYIISKSIIYSLRASAETCGIEMKYYVTLIEDMIMSKDSKEKTSKYTKDHNNPAYVRLFVSACYQCYVFGDSNTNNDKSLFCKNIQIIKEELKYNITKTEKRNFKFMGFSLITLAPGLFLNLFYNVAINFIGETQSFYNKYGLFIRIAVIVCTWYVYSLVYRLKRFKVETQDNVLLKRIEKITNFKFGKKTEKRISYKLSLLGRTVTPNGFLNEMIFIAATALVLGSGLTIFTNINTKIKILNNKEVGSYINVVDTETAVSTIIKYSKIYKSGIDESEEKELLPLLGEDLKSNSEYVREELLNEIKNRISEYRSIKLLTWKAYLMCLLISFLCGISPLLSLEMQWFLFVSRKNEETRMFQVILLLFKNIPNISLITILNEMESHSFMYQSLLQSVNNLYSYNQDEALRLLKAEAGMEMKSNPDFSEMANALCSFPKIGAIAFSNIEDDIQLSKQHDDVMAEKEQTSSLAIIGMISYIPAALVVGGYFMVPFIITTLSEVRDTMSTLSQLGL